MAKAKAWARALRSGVNQPGLTNSVTGSAHQAWGEQPISARTAPVFKDPRIIAGIVIEPPTGDPVTLA